MKHARLVSFFGEDTSPDHSTAVMNESVKPHDIDIAGRERKSKWLYQTTCPRMMSPMPGRFVCLKSSGGTDIVFHRRCN